MCKVSFNLLSHSANIMKLKLQLIHRTGSMAWVIVGERARVKDLPTFIGPQIHTKSTKTSHLCRQVCKNFCTFSNSTP